MRGMLLIVTSILGKNFATSRNKDPHIIGKRAIAGQGNKLEIRILRFGRGGLLVGLVENADPLKSNGLDLYPYEFY